MMFASYQSVFFRCLYVMSVPVISSALSVSIPESAVLIDDIE